MSNRRKCVILFLLLLAGAGAIRIAVAHYLPNDAPDDGRMYSRIARNVIVEHVFSDATTSPYDPTLIRLPGYPLFLAAIYKMFGLTNDGAVRVVQALIDTTTCALVALLAFYWQPDEKRKFATAMAAFFLAAVCPFTMIYAATILTEVPTMFLAVAMCIAATLAFRAIEKENFTTETRRSLRNPMRRSLGWWCVAGLLGGLAVLLRPDSGLFAAAIGLTLVATNIWSAVASAARHRFGSTIEVSQATDPKRRRRFALPAHSTLLSMFACGSVFSFAFVLVLVPWTIRNERVFHLFQPLAPAHGEMPDEFVSRGYYTWLRTWLDDERYIGPFLWSLDSERITLDQVPPQAFDSEDEKTRVAALLEKYNHPPDSEADNASPAQPAPQPNSSSTEVKVPQSTASPDAANKQANANQTTSNSKAKQDTNENANSGQSGDENDQSDESDQSDEGDNADNGDQPDQPPEPVSVEMTPEVDAGFAQLARERIARHPIRYHVWLPMKRAGTMWLNTHAQYWPFDGELFPLADLDHDTYQQYFLPLFAGVTWIYTLLGLAGAWLLWRSRNFAARRWLLLAALLIFIRLGFFATLENPEPRYVLEFFPFLAALGGIAIGRVFPIKSTQRVQPEQSQE